MATIVKSARRYEDWLREQLPGDVRERDLADKHDKMRESAFVFLRATYWRWAETIFDVCPHLASGPRVLAVGDIHLENFGTWRDVDGRLVWGVNDFDEAAEMPYGLDLVRLAVSALLERAGGGISDEEICTAILRGYRAGLRAPRPVVLDHDQQWLRHLLVATEKERAKFWKNIAAMKEKPAPARYLRVIVGAMPEPGLSIKTAPRTAGTGSLGRPRWVGTADWRGAPVVREAKALLTSAWCRAQVPSARAVRAGEIANGRFRPLDPWYEVKNDVVVRRLSPNNRKIEVEKGNAALFSRDMLQIMGFELANVHLGTADRRGAIQQDLEQRRRSWLIASARKAADATLQEYKAWKAS
jgi:hypothetical protein